MSSLPKFYTGVYTGVGHPVEVIKADSISQRIKTIAGWEKRPVAWGDGV